jgi:hypothetical protein
MNKLLEELSMEIKAARPPKDAVTVKELCEEVGEEHNFIRDYLNAKVKDEGWKSSTWKGAKYFWKWAPYSQ